MAKRRRELDSVVTASEMSEFNTVFVDTSLDTHLAMLVSCSDTVSDFKKRMALEHKQCFPTIGEILVRSVKVKRRSNFYHLPDIMLVWNAFHGVKHNWFLSADVSGANTFHSIETSCKFDTNNGVKMAVTNLDDNCRGLSSDVNRIHTLSIPLPDDGATQKNVASEMIAGLNFEKSVEKATDFQSNIFPVEKCKGTDSRPKKKRKVRNTEDAYHNPRSEDDCNLFQSSSEDALIPEVVGSGNVMVDAVRESPGGGTLHEQNGKENDHYDAEDRVMFIGTSPPTTTEKSTLRSTVTSQNLLASDERKEENVLEGKMDHELAQDAPSNLLEGVSICDHSPRLTDAGDLIGEVDTDGSKSEKNKVQRNVQVSTYMDPAEKGGNIKPCSETHESDRKEEEKVLSLEPSNSKAFGHVALESGLKETSSLRDGDAVMEPEISSGTNTKKKRKKRKKHINTNPEQLGIEQTNYSTSGLPPPPTDDIPEETSKQEGITNHEGKDFQVLLGSCTGDATEKDQIVNTNVGDSLMLTQTERTLEDVGAGKKFTDIMAQKSASNPHADFPAVETENPIWESHQVEKGNESTETKDRKASKRRKKRKLTTSQVHEDLPVEGHNLGGLATKETSISFVNSEQEERHVDSSQVLSSKSEEKLNATNGIVQNTYQEKLNATSGIVQNTYHLEKTSEKEGKGINFTQYFVPSKSSQEMATPKRVEDNVVPSVCNSTELQSSIKYFENNKADKSRRKSSSRSKGDSTQNSDRNETISNSFRRSSGASEKAVKDYGSSEMCETTLQKPDGALAASSRQDKKNRRSLHISSSERRLGVFPVKQGSKRFQLGANVTHKMLMKTPQRMILLTKPGAIFQDTSGESSGDENGTMHSDGSTLSPSDSSSMSGNSDESDLSHGSTRNAGSSYADGRSAGRRSMSKLELSASKDDITMDMILRSSKRFQKAKLLASQNAADEENESQPIEFVPESQPS